MESVSTDTFPGGAMPSVSVHAQKAANSTAPKDPRLQWSYEEAFKRNRGLITEEEQEKLRDSHVAIAGMGGVGGVNLVALTRLGVGKFTIADPDVFEVANFNRQYGGTISNLGRNKAEAMAEAALDINPELQVRVVKHAIDEQNVGTFLEGADLLVDSVDAFHLDIRRVLFRCAADLGIYAIGAGPVGFSTAWVAFSPESMTFDDYFAFEDGQDEREQFIRYIVGMAPRATQRDYVDARYVDLAGKHGPSVGAACNLASGVLATDCAKLLLGRGRVWVAPYFQQFDPYVGKCVRGRLPRGNRSILQRFKCWYVRNRLCSIENGITS